MGYFPNGTAFEDYAARYCDRCIHGNGACVVVELHFLHNYDECDKPESMLHTLIPRQGVDNLACRLFVEVAEGHNTKHLVTDLREFAAAPSTGDEIAAVMREAADEIMRLTTTPKEEER